MGTSNSHGRAEDRKEHWLIDDCRSAISGELDDLRAKINELGNKMVAMQTKLEAEVKSSAKKSEQIDEFSKRQDELHSLEDATLEPPRVSRPPSTPPPAAITQALHGIAIVPSACTPGTVLDHIASHPGQNAHLSWIARPEKWDDRGEFLGNMVVSFRRCQNLPAPPLPVLDYFGNLSHLADLPRDTICGTYFTRTFWKAGVDCMSRQISWENIPHVLRLTGVHSIEALGSSIKRWADADAFVKHVLQCSFTNEHLRVMSRGGAWSMDCVLVGQLKISGRFPLAMVSAIFSHWNLTFFHSNPPPPRRNENYRGNVMELLGWLSMEADKTEIGMGLAYHSMLDAPKEPEGHNNGIGSCSTVGRFPDPPRGPAPEIEDDPWVDVPPLVVNLQLQATSQPGTATPFPQSRSLANSTLKQNAFVKTEALQQSQTDFAAT